jgi:hypothetical protein
MQRIPIRPVSRPVSGAVSADRLISLCILLIAGVMALSSCGSKSSVDPNLIHTLSGNWQFTEAPPADGSFSGGLQGGFLLQNGGSVNGSVLYSVALPPTQSGGTPTACSSGSASITGSLNGQSVSLTAVAGTQTFTLTGTLSFDGSTVAGTYSTTSGTDANGNPCGTAQTGLQWSAVLLPILTGPLQGSFHSAGGSAGLANQVLLVSGDLIQDPNTGTSSAGLSGVLDFTIAPTGISDYPCIVTANVVGQISGETVTLQLTGSNGSNIGQIGGALGSQLQPLNFVKAPRGYILHSTGGPAYAVYSPACGGGSLGNPADFGTVCLGLSDTQDCSQPITLTPSALVFPTLVQGEDTSQNLVLTNTTNSAILGVTIAVTNDNAPGSYSEIDDCGDQGVTTNGAPFNLLPQQSCLVVVIYTPQCGTQCSADPLTGSVVVINPANLTIYKSVLSGTVLPGSAPAHTAFAPPADRVPQALPIEFYKKTEPLKLTASSRNDRVLHHE